MQTTITTYIAIAYGMTAVSTLTEKFIEEFPYMEGENMAISLPDRLVNSKIIPPGLLFNSINAGAVITR